MIAHEHEIHRRRWGRNLGLGLVLAGFVALIFGVTVAKISKLEEGRLPGETQKVGVGE
ncbi:MAG: hypothetical protein ACOY4T_08935 [Pseudomonadota bacterium]